MNLLLTGNGEREKSLRALCEQRGHRLPEHGPWDAVILPLPQSRIDEEYADQLPRGQTVVCGKTDAFFDRLADRRGWDLKKVLEDERFTKENAALTAEGAVYTAMAHSDRSLMGAQCLVTGYGRIGRDLTRLLRALGSIVTVAARRRESREEAGPNSIDMPDIHDVTGKMDLIFNTVPARVFSIDALRRIRLHALLIDLASAPYGVDPADAENLGVQYRLESGLPGRYCPLSAAMILLDYVEREVRHE
ncbi:MAG: hypothetical protein IKQ41_10005 [Clostridia bacterium]|nr:hypothetical protein [Clostridia bacterium]